MVGGLSWIGPLAAQEFRLETQVYSGSQSAPVSENLTLFTEKVVYDFLFATENPAAVSEIVIFDRDQRRFVLLDSERKVKLEVTATDLAQLIDSLKTSELWREKYPFMLEPSFTVAFDSATQKLELNSRHITYSVTTQTPARSYAYPVFGEFMDAYAQLNATDPQKLPPFARLILNRELKSRGLMPTAVEFKMDLPNAGLGSRTVSAISKHSVIWQLSKTDRERIDEANRFWTEFRSVGLVEYRGLPPQTASRPR
jgi:hypothetical protein